MLSVNYKLHNKYRLFLMLVGDIFIASLNPLTRWYVCIYSSLRCLKDSLTISSALNQWTSFMFEPLILIVLLLLFLLKDFVSGLPSDMTVIN